MNSIRGRLLTILLSGLALLLVGGGSIVFGIARAGLVRQFDDGLDARAHTIAALIKVEPCRETPDGPIVGCSVFELGDAPAATMRETFFVVWDHSGRVAKRSGNLGDATLPANTPAEGRMRFADVALPDDLPGRAAWHAFRPRVDPDDWEGLDPDLADPQVMVVGAALDRSAMDAALNRLLGTLAGAGAVIGIVLALLLVLGIRWGLHPLDRLRAQLESVEGDIHARRFDGGDAPRELAPVYRELNGMLERVEQTLVRERLFADAAAHELRTPLAELRTAAEVALRWPDLDRAEPALREALVIGNEMERLVDSLLLISRGQAAATWARGAAAPLGPIVRGCLERVDDSIVAKGLTVDVTLNGAATLGAPSDAVEIIVRNLISNAVHYTPARGSILIGNGQGTGGGAALYVENGPVELDAADVPRLFEPFWRREGARSDRRHSGLGLAVVDQIARAIGLRVEAELAGDRLRIRLANSTVAPDGEQ